MQDMFQTYQQTNIIKNTIKLHKNIQENRQFHLQDA